jgi:ABC-type sugar transport system ATPase subunit
VLGLRPQDGRLAPPSQDGFEATVEQVEPLTAGQCLITVRRGEGRLGVLVPGPSTPREGEAVRVVFDLSRGHWFDPNSGRSLSAMAAC